LSKGRTILLILVAVILLTVMILTWGSVGSIVMGMGLVLMGASLLYRRFLIDRDEDYFLE